MTLSDTPDKHLAVELFFDSETTERLRRVWDSLGSHLPSLGSEPHISLSCHDLTAGTRLREIVEEYAQHARPLSLSLASIGTFPTAEAVIFAAPIVTQELLSLHAAFHDRLFAAGLASHHYYQPSAWVPHVTLALDVPLDKVGATIKACRELDIYGPAHVKEIGIIEFTPSREVCRFNLGTSKS